MSWLHTQIWQVNAVLSDILNVFDGQFSCNFWWSRNCSRVEVRVSWTEARSTAVVVRLSWRHFSSVTRPEFSSLFVADHEFGLSIFRAGKLRVAAAEFLQCSSELVQDERIVVVPRGGVHVWVVRLRRAMHLHSITAGAGTRAWFCDLWYRYTHT